MSLFPATAKVGNDAGWHLAFFRDPAAPVPLLSVGSADYYASIEATLPTNLEGGVYNIAIEGITNAHYDKLHQVISAHAPLYVDLYLYWRDAAGVLGYLANVAGLTDALGAAPAEELRVARLVVTKLSRRAGERRYEAVIEATERVYAALAKPLANVPAPADDPRSAAVAIANDALSSIDPARRSVSDALLPAGVPGPDVPKTEPRKWKTGVDALAELERAMTAVAKKTGRGMYLIRDGRLHVGLRRIPLEGTGQTVTDAEGLVHVETSGKTGDRTSYALICKGRPDVRPGDKLSFVDPGRQTSGDPTDFATTSPSSFGAALSGLATSAFGGATALGGLGVELYVSSVNHKLSRTEGFVTAITGVEISLGDEWDDVDDDDPDAAVCEDPAATPHGDVAQAIKHIAKRFAGEHLAIGEVRAATTTGATEPPSQTVDAWIGTVADDGHPGRARRLAIDRATKQRASGIPYATPFAWGKCGLVLPRYPGTRVVLGHVEGLADDPVELGAIWESGHGPDAEPGDWWLSLPAAVDAAKRRSAEDGDVPQEPAQHASNDLIDAAGARTIEVGRLTVRVQPKQLAQPGTRPPAPSVAAEQVTIEHENGSRIVIKENGDIVIHSEANLSLSAKQAVTVEADSMTVKVKQKLEVTDP